MAEENPILNDVKMSNRSIVRICPHCSELIMEDELCERYTINISNKNPVGETYLYHKSCLDELLLEKLETDNMDWREEPDYTNFD